MPTLYVENVPEEIYAALRQRAQSKRTSISAEVLGLLAEGVPSEAEIARRKAVVAGLRGLRARKSPGPGPFPSTEEMVREDRDR